MTIHDDSFPASPEVDAGAPALTRRYRPNPNRLAALAAGAAPSRPSTETSLAGAFERMQMRGLGGAATVPVTHGKCVLVVHEDISSVSNCTLCGVEVGQN